MSTPLPQTPALRRAILSAERIAIKNKDDCIQSGHLLLAFLTDEVCAAGDALKNHNFTYQIMRKYLKSNNLL